MKLVCVGEEETVVGLHVIGIGAGGWVAAVPPVRGRYRVDFPQRIETRSTRDRLHF